MKIRQLKKNAKKMNDAELDEHVAYCEDDRKRAVYESEFVRRNPDLFDNSWEDDLW